MNVGIVGIRNVKKEYYLELKKELDRYKDNITQIVSGGAKGIDSMAAKYARENNIPLIEYYPRYDKFPGKYAPIERNKDIIKQSNIVIAFWDGEGRGTKNSIELSIKNKKELKIIDVPENFQIIGKTRVKNNHEYNKKRNNNLSL
jgi:hypothetical protein